MLGGEGGAFAREGPGVGEAHAHGPQGRDLAQNIEPGGGGAREEAVERSVVAER